MAVRDITLLELHCYTLIYECTRRICELRDVLKEIHFGQEEKYEVIKYSILDQISPLEAFLKESKKRICMALGLGNPEGQAYIEWVNEVSEYIKNLGITSAY